MCGGGGGEGGRGVEGRVLTEREKNNVCSHSAVMRYTEPNEVIRSHVHD